MSKISFSAYSKPGLSYAVAKTTNVISSDEICEKAVALAGINIDPNIAKGIVAAALRATLKEVAEGNRVKLPYTLKDDFGSAYPILENATLKTGDKDSEGNLISPTVENLVSRASQFRVRMGFQVGQNFSTDLNSKSSLEWNGQSITINTTDSDDDSEGGNQGNEGEDNQDA